MIGNSGLKWNSIAWTQQGKSLSTQSTTDVPEVALTAGQLSKERVHSPREARADAFDLYPLECETENEP